MGSHHRTPAQSHVRYSKLKSHEQSLFPGFRRSLLKKLRSLRSLRRLTIFLGNSYHRGVEALQRFIFIMLRIPLFVLLIGIFLLVGTWVHWRVKDPLQRKIRFSNMVHKVTKLCCRAFGIRVQALNEPPKETPGLVVGNHLGFLDILAAGSIRPLLFVTSQEMKNTPGLGLITEMGGCLYVERRNRMGIKQELNQITHYLKHGMNVCLYPEATSHNGECVLPFKRSLITAAIHAQVPIWPYVVNFRSVEGEVFSLSNRDKVCWYGDIPFAKSMLSALSLRYVEIEIKFLDPVYPHAEIDTREISQILHKKISQEFIPVRIVD